MQLPPRMATSSPPKIQTDGNQIKSGHNQTQQFAQIAVLGQTHAHCDPTMKQKSYDNSLGHPMEESQVSVSEPVVTHADISEQIIRWPTRRQGLVCEQKGLHRLSRPRVDQDGRFSAHGNVRSRPSLTMGLVNY